MTGQDPNTGWWVGAGRAVMLRCPRCGRAPVFRRFVVMNPSCAACGLVFDRGDGYWLGAMMFNMAVGFAAVVVVFLGTLWLTSPDPNWNLVLVATVAAAAVVPLAFFPFSRTLWIAAERAARLQSSAEEE